MGVGLRARADAPREKPSSTHSLAHSPLANSMAAGQTAWRPLGSGGTLLRRQRRMRLYLCASCDGAGSCPKVRSTRSMPISACGGSGRRSRSTRGMAAVIVTVSAASAKGESHHAAFPRGPETSLAVDDCPLLAPTLAPAAVGAWWRIGRVAGAPVCTRCGSTYNASPTNRRPQHSATSASSKGVLSNMASDTPAAL